MDNTRSKPLAVVTGASSGIGRELALCCARAHHDVILAADLGDLEGVASRCRLYGVQAWPVQADLATPIGLAALLQAIGDRPVDALLANAGHGLGHAFLDQDFDQARHVIDTNVTGTLGLIHRVVHDMRERRRGRVLITGSIAGLMPGSFQAVYNASKAFIDSFALALRNELQGTGVTVTCLMPGVTDTAFFQRADMLDTKVGADPDKADPAEVAEIGFDAMLAGEAQVVAGWKNKLQATLAHVTPSQVLAQRHRQMAEPGTRRR